MGQSNSTSPIIQQLNELQYNYSRLILQNKQIIKQKKKQHPFKKYNKSKILQYCDFREVQDSLLFILDQFQSLSTDNQLVIQQQDKINQTLCIEANTKPFLGRRTSNFSNTQYSVICMEVPSEKKQQFLSSNQSPILSRSRVSQLSNPKIQNSRINMQNYIISITSNLTLRQSKVITYFEQQKSMQNYVSNLIKLHQLTKSQWHHPNQQSSNPTSTPSPQSSQFHSPIYQDFNLKIQQNLFVVERNFPNVEFTTQLTKQNLRNLEVLLDYLCFVGGFYQKFQNLFIKPQNVFVHSNSFYLLAFQFRINSPFDNLLATIHYVFKEDYQQLNIQQCFVKFQQERLNEKMPVYIQELWNALITKKIQRYQLSSYLNKLRQKSKSFPKNIDSFHACLRLKKTSIFAQEKHQWLLGKKFNEIYFYHIQDEHRCQVKIVRKKKKIDLSSTKIILDPEQLSIKYIGQNSKLVLHAPQLQLQKSSCISDIQIRHKLPIKLKSPFIFLQQKMNKLIILQSCIYSFNITQNIVSQQTRKISDSIFLCRSTQYTFMVIRISIDIFKSGIRIFVRGEEHQLAFVVMESEAEELANIRVDLKHIDFCKEIFKGVYFMMAHRNFWVLDLNFKVFFSYATIHRLKAFYGFAKNNHNAEVDGQFAFEIFNQPFRVDFLMNQEGLNVKIKDQMLHIIGEISGNMYYFKYLFMPQIGSLKLIDYKTLAGVNPKPKVLNSQKLVPKQQLAGQVNNQSKKKKKVRILSGVIQQQKQNIPKQMILKAPLQTNSSFLSKKSCKTLSLPNERSRYSFKFHQQNLLYYKHQQWLYFNSLLFISPKNFFLSSNKTNYEISLSIPQLSLSLKQLIQKMRDNKNNRKFARHQVVMYFLRLLDIFQYITKKKYQHKNFNIGNLYFDNKNVLKLIGWSEPSRNWYVSDFKDLLLVFFNIITSSTIQKLNQKTLLKYQKEIKEFGEIIYEKMMNAFRTNKVVQKKSQVQKQIAHLKQFLHKEFAKIYLQPNSKINVTQTKTLPISHSQPIGQTSIASPSSCEFIFNFQYNTPRISVISTTKSKMKKLKCLLDQNSKQQLIFNQTDKHLWNQSQKKLYIFTAMYQFFQISVNTNNYKQETVFCQDYQYLPHNILESTFIFVDGWGVFSVGGVYKTKMAQLNFNMDVYKFNTEKLTWDVVGQIPQARMNPHLVLSADNTQIYVFAGEVGKQRSNVRVFTIKLLDKKHMNSQIGYQIDSFIDPVHANPFNKVLSLYPFKIYNLSKKYNIFLIFYITNEKYYVKLFSLTSFDLNILIDTKNYTDENKIISSGVGICMDKGVFHVLRQYGKYSRIEINKFENLILTSKTIYPQRQQNKANNQNQ